MGSRGIQRHLRALTIALLGGTGFPLLAPRSTSTARRRAPSGPPTPRPPPLEFRRFSVTLSEDGGLEELVDVVRQEIGLPIESLEVAAFLESIGVSSEMAKRRYRADSVFALAKAVLSQLRKRAAPDAPSPRIAPPASSLLSDWVEVARGPLSVLTVVVLFLALAAYRRFGEWGDGNILAMSMGMTGSMVLANAFIQGAARRGAIYVSRGNPRAALAFLLRVLMPASACVVVTTAVCSVLAARFGLLTADGVLVFSSSFIVLAGLWFLSGVLSVFQLQAWFGMAIVSGLASGVLADRLVVRFSPHHLAAGTAVGMLVALAIIIHPIRRTVARQAGDSPLRAQLPTIPYLLHEATPYFAYGVLYVSLLLLPHLLGWVGRLHGMPRLQAISTLEVALTLTLAPVLASEGIAEHAARRLWTHARAAQVATPVGSRYVFGRSLIGFWRLHFGVYVAVLIVLSVLADVFFALRGEQLGRLLQLSTPELVAPLAEASLLAYLLLGAGLFNCVFCVTLARPQVAVRSTLLGLLVTLAIGAPLSVLGDFTWCLVGFVAGAGAFALVSSWETLRTLESGDYYYVASF